MRRWEIVSDSLLHSSPLRFIMAINLEGHQPVLCAFFSTHISSMHAIFSELI